MSVEYRYRDAEALAVQEKLTEVPEYRLEAANMIGLQRAVITELRSAHAALEVRVAALEEENRKLRGKPQAETLIEHAPATRECHARPWVLNTTQRVKWAMAYVSFVPGRPWRLGDSITVEPNHAPSCKCSLCKPVPYRGDPAYVNEQRAQSISDEERVRRAVRATRDDD